MSSGDFVGVAVQEFTLDELSMAGSKVEGTTLRYMLPSGEFKKVNWEEIFVDDEGNDLADEDIYVGWADSITAYPAHYTFKPGEGFFVTPAGLAVEPKLVSSGALYSSDSTLARIGVLLTKGFQEITSNPMPGGTLELDSIIMTGSKVEGTTLRYMLPSGEFKKVNWEEIFVDDKGNDLADEDIYIGWADSITAYPAHYTFKAGESYFVTPAGLAVNPYISYPNPLYVAPAGK